MTIRKLALALGVGAVLTSAAIWSVQAADHADSPATANEPAADVDDVYTWMSSDTTDLNLAMTIGRDVPSTFRLSDRVQYVFHVASRATFGATPGPEFNIICQTAGTDQIQCWAGNDHYVSGNASSTAGIETEDARFKVFAGVRQDPFFFNLAGFQGVARTVGTVAGSLTFDQANCPTLDGATSNSLVTALRTGKDDFLGFEAFAIVVSIDKSLVNGNGPILSVWGSTNRRAS